MLLKICPIEWGFFMNIKFLVLVFIGIFFSCLGLSKLANFYFDISSDYLTASATFFAAFVALYLFHDWREQHKFTALELLKVNIQTNFFDIDSSFEEFRKCLFVKYVDGNNFFSQYSRCSKKLNQQLELACQNLGYYEKLLSSYSIDESILKVKPEELGELIISIYEDINIPFNLNDFDKMIFELRKNVTAETAGKFTDLKAQSILLSSDIQKFTIKYLTERRR